MNKKIILLAAAALTMLFTACGGTKSSKTTDETDTLAFEQEQIEENIMAQLDSIADLWGSIKPTEGLYTEGKIQLTEDEKKVKPTYLLKAKDVADLSLLSQKYRAIGMLTVDRNVMLLHEGGTEVMDAALTKIASEVGDNAIKGVNSKSMTDIKGLYKNEKENGRINLFWEMASAAIIENLYVTSQNLDKFILAFNDQQASDLSYQVALLKLSLDDLATYDSNIKELDELLAPLNSLNASNVEEFKAQLKAMKPQIETIREQMLK